MWTKWSAACAPAWAPRSPCDTASAAARSPFITIHPKNWTPSWGNCFSMDLLFNATVHTLDPGRPLASAILIDHGRILAVGHEDELLGMVDRLDNRIDLKGRAVLPG